MDDKIRCNVIVYFDDGKHIDFNLSESEYDGFIQFIESGIKDTYFVSARENKSAFYIFRAHLVNVIMRTKA